MNALTRGLGFLAAWALTLAGAIRAQEISPRQALDRAEVLWATKKPPAYEFAVETQCFCAPVTALKPRVRVKGAEIWSDSIVNGPVLQAYPYNTIDKLFQILRGYASRNAVKMAVQYDAEWGIPVSADLDGAQMVFDDELRFKVSGFRVLPAETTSMAPIADADLSKYRGITDLKAWRNPFLVVDVDWVAVKSESSPDWRLIRNYSMLDALTDLPASDWPHGRVVAIATPSAATVPPRGPSRVSAQDVDRAIQELTVIRVQAYRWGS